MRRTLHGLFAFVLVVGAGITVLPRPEPATPRTVSRIVATPIVTPSPTPSPVPTVAAPVRHVARKLPARPRVQDTPAPAPVRAPRSAVRGSRVVSSTAYCLTSDNAAQRRPRDGDVAMNGVALGSRWHVVDGPFAGRTLVVADRIGHGSQFDIWMASCDAARDYGRRRITVEPV